MPIAKPRKIILSTLSRARWYFLKSAMKPVFKIFFFLILVLESVRFKLELDIALHQPEPLAALVSFLVLWLPIYVSVGLQFSLFVGMMIGIGGVSKSRELDVFHALGLGLHNLMAPVMSCVFAIALFTFLVLGWAQPLAIYATKVFGDALQASTNILLDGGNLIFKDGGKTVFIDGISARGQNFERIFSFEEFKNGDSQTTTGSIGQLNFGKGFSNWNYTIKNSMVFDLSEKQDSENKIKLSNLTQAETLSGNLGRGNRPDFRARGASEYEWTMLELLLPSGKIFPKMEQHRISAEIHYRFAQLIFLLILPLLAAIVVIEPRRNPGPMRQGLAAIFVLAFHQYLSMGANISRNNIQPPLLTLWLPLLVLAGVVLWRFWKLSFRPGFGTAR